MKKKCVSFNLSGEFQSCLLKHPLASNLLKPGAETSFDSNSKARPLHWTWATQDHCLELPWPKFSKSSEATSKAGLSSSPDLKDKLILGSKESFWSLTGSIQRTRKLDQFSSLKFKSWSGLKPKNSRLVRALLERVRVSSYPGWLKFISSSFQESWYFGSNIGENLPEMKHELVENFWLDDFKEFLGFDWTQFSDEFDRSGSSLSHVFLLRSSPSYRYCWQN